MIEPTPPARRLTLGGHSLNVSITNTGCLIPVCECGWFGTVHGIPVERKKGGMKRYDRSAAEQACAAQHRAHMTEALTA